MSAKDKISDLGASIEDAQREKRSAAEATCGIILAYILVTIAMVSFLGWQGLGVSCLLAGAFLFWAMIT